MEAFWSGGPDHLKTNEKWALDVFSLDILDLLVEKPRMKKNIKIMIQLICARGAVDMLLTTTYIIRPGNPGKLSFFLVRF